MKMHYPWRVVAFIDILGFKEAIDKSAEDEAEHDRIKDALEELRKLFLKPKDSHDIQTDRALDADTQIIQVSDSLVISRKIEEKGGLYYMLFDCALATHVLIQHGFLCRGAITRGQLFHEESFLFGPAFVEVYQMEAKQPLPLIAFDKELFEIAEHFPHPANAGYEDWEVGFIKKNCRMLNEHTFYLDYFTDYDDLVGPGPGEATAHYEHLRRILERGLNEEQHRSPFLKTLWAAVQFNRTAARFGLEPLSIPEPKEALSEEERSKFDL